jgi:putative heme-binding domain-containing protein
VSIKRRCPGALWCAVALSILCCQATVARAQSAGTAGGGKTAGSPLVRLLKAGRLPKERLGGVIGLVCRSGSADDLTYVYEQAIKPDALAADVRILALDGLAEAAATRKLRPAGDLSGVVGLIEADAVADPALRLAAVRLAGACQVAEAAAALERIALAAESDAALRPSAIQALVNIGGDPPRRTIDALSAADRPHDQRQMAIAALAQLDPQEAARRAAELLSRATADVDPAPLLDGFLSRVDGTRHLAAALGEAANGDSATGGTSLQPDVARLCLRHMYSIGRSDAELVTVLSAAAGIGNDVVPLSPEAMQATVAEVAERGDAARGEAIFRRGDLSCLKCHAVSGAGGRVGPDLSPVGSSSPVDYLVNSIMVPDLAVKEAFVTHIVTTTDGQIVQGVLVEKDESRLVLRDATGRDVTVPVADIDDQAEGKSMMPKGLVNFLTHDEFIDLVRFLSELGKPGPYAIRPVASIQRWRVLYPDPAGAPAKAPETPEEVARFRATVLNAPAEHWTPAYARVAGELPLDELLIGRGVSAGRDVLTEGNGRALYLRGEINVTVPGAAMIRVNSAAGLHVWLDDQPIAPAAEMPIELTAGPHALTFHVDMAERDLPVLKVEFPPVPGSKAALSVVGGP